MTTNSSYPYTGGIYGGYSDPENNKKKPFIDTEADKKAKGVVNRLAAPVRNYSQGVQDTLNKTSEAYEKGGLGAAAGQYVRGTIADTGNALVQGVAKPAAAVVGDPAISISKGVSNFAKTLVTGDPTPVGQSPATQPQASAPSVPPAQAAPVQPPGAQPAAAGTTALTTLPSHTPRGSLGKPGRPAANPMAEMPKFRTVLPGGITYEGDMKGNRSYTMGTPGQDGYGKMTVAGGQQPATRLSSPVRQQQSAYSFSGSEEDRARFMKPVYRSGAQYTGRMLSPIHPDYTEINKPYVDPRANPLTFPVSGRGLGYGARKEMFREANETARATARNRLDEQRIGLEERGVGINEQRLGLEGKNLELNRQRVGGEIDLNRARIGSEQINQQKGQMEVANAQRLEALQQQYIGEADPAKQRALGNQLLTLQGKNPKEWQIAMREEAIDPTNPQSPMRKIPYAVNLIDPNQIIDIGKPTIGSADVARQRALLQGMSASDRTRHLQNLAQWNPDLFDALRASTQQAVKQPRTLASPVQPSTGQLMP